MFSGYPKKNNGDTVRERDAPRTKLNEAMQLPSGDPEDDQPETAEESSWGNCGEFYTILYIYMYEYIYIVYFLDFILYSPSSCIYTCLYDCIIH